MIDKKSAAAALMILLVSAFTQNAAAEGASMPKGPDLTAGRITGIGGVFFRSKNPTALAAWYRDTLGLKVESWGGAVLAYDEPGHPPAVVWSPFAETSDYMSPSKREFMMNFAVDDLDAFLARLKTKGVTVLDRRDIDPNGKFAWILDPDGTKIELWQPK